MKFLPKKTIVVPFDFSDRSVRAVDTALQVAGDESQVHIIHILQELNVADPGVIWQTVDNENRAKHATESMQQRLAGQPYNNLKLHVDFGDPGHRITEVAAQIGADLIVMPSHGRRGIKRLLIGSVAERVVRLSHCPVLILRN